eukprot:TRINITY_DN76656_c0_g1_i1.p1 TRINITY_DN76656_c0_g1~~TRINITY_DN76656_c0_g1_i1.p1  ORF type:complete len:166 (-),score=20.71 TRINITY_DN76656_c0_g1_i1:17-514(-)
MADLNLRFSMDDSNDSDDGQFPINFSEVDLTFDDKEEDVSRNRSSVVSSLREKAKMMRLTERRSVKEHSSRSMFSSVWRRFTTEPPTETKDLDTQLNGVMPSSVCPQITPTVIREPLQPRARAASVQNHRRVKRVGMVVWEGEASKIVPVPSNFDRLKNSIRGRR